MAKPGWGPALGHGQSDYESTRAHFEGGMEVLAVRGGHFCHRESPKEVIGGLLKHFAANQNFTLK